MEGEPLSAAHRHLPCGFAVQVGAVLGGVLLLVVAVTGVVLAKGWNTDVTLLVISCIFPLVGHVTGFLLAFLTHQSWQRYSHATCKV